MTTLPGLGAPSTIVPATDLAHMGRPADTDYKLTLWQARGDRIYNVMDYGATGDGTTDDRVAIQACIDAAMTSNTVHNVIYFPAGIYRVTASSSVGLTCFYHATWIGEGAYEGNIGTVIKFDTADATGARLFEFKNTGGSPTIPQSFQYHNTWENITFTSTGDTVVDQYCFQFGDGTAIADALYWRMTNCNISKFTGACFHFVHVGTTATTAAFSYSTFIGLVCDDIGGMFKTTNTGVGDKVIGTAMTFINLHIHNGGWNETSPTAWLIDLMGLREVTMINTVIEGAGPTSNPQTAYFRMDGHGWLRIEGIHVEIVNDWPTYFIEFTGNIDPVWTRHCSIKHSNNLFNFDGVKLANMHDYVTLTLEDCTIPADFPDTGDWIVETNSSLGQWQIELKDCWTPVGFTVNERHIGRVHAESFSTGIATNMLRQQEQPLLDYRAYRDGWLCQTVGGGAGTMRYGSNFVYAYLSTSFNEVGIVEDPTEGRVFAVRYPAGTDAVLSVQFNLPSSFWGTGVGVQGAQIHYSTRWRWFHSESSDPAMFWGSNTGNTNGNSYHKQNIQADKDTWYTSANSMILDGAGTLVTAGSSSADTTANNSELRLSMVEAGFGGHATLFSGSGGLVRSTANEMRPLRWYNDGPPTWGDYIDGDRVDPTAPAVGNPSGWLCTTAGALASAWQATTAYDIGDWVENDTPNRIYKCVTAGTSAGSGGPTGTGTGIADGPDTLVWDFHDTEAVFTALANV